VILSRRLSRGGRARLHFSALAEFALREKMRGAFELLRIRAVRAGPATAVAACGASKVVGLWKTALPGLKFAWILRGYKRWPRPPAPPLLPLKEETKNAHRRPLFCGNFYPAAARRLPRCAVTLFNPDYHLQRLMGLRALYPPLQPSAHQQTHPHYVFLRNFSRLQTFLTSKNPNCHSRRKTLTPGS